MSRFVLALDQGTTSSRAILFDHRGRIQSASQEEFPQYFPQAGWVEHNPKHLWESIRRSAERAVKKQGCGKKAIAAIGITNQRETTLVWDRRTGRPLHRAIVWQDRRTAAACAALGKADHGPEIRKKTGLLLDPYFSGTKLAWLLDNVPGLRKKAGRGEVAFGTVDTWLLWNLTGGKVHATDASNASRTLLFNLKTTDWDEGLLRLLKIPREVLPCVRTNSEILGTAETIPSLRGIPISGMAGDQQAALFGQACFEAGSAKNTYGTGCFLLMNTGTHAVFSKNKLLTTVAWKIGNRTDYALEGSVFIGGAVVQWLRDGLGIIRKSSDIERLAAGVADNGGVCFVPAFAGLGAPHWDPLARGSIFGLTRGTTAAHIARAALESIAFQTADLLTAMRADTGLRVRLLKVDGGASVNSGLMQFQSDLLGAQVVRARTTEATALGAAFLAGLAVGFWKDRREISSLWRPDRTWTPSGSPAEIGRLQKEWARAVGRARGWASA